MRSRPRSPSTFPGRRGKGSQRPCRAVHPADAGRGSGSRGAVPTRCVAYDRRSAAGARLPDRRHHLRAGRPAVGWAGRATSSAFGLRVDPMRSALKVAAGRTPAVCIAMGSMRTLLRGILVEPDGDPRRRTPRDGYPWSGTARAGGRRGRPRLLGFSPAGSLPGRTWRLPLQSRLLHLSQRIARQFRHQDDAARTLVHRQPVGDVGLQGRRAAPSATTLRDDPLAEVGSGSPTTAASRTAGWVSRAASISPAPIR